MIPYKEINVLVLDGVGRQALPILADLYKLGCIITVVCTSKLDVGYNSRYSTYRILTDKAIYEENMANGIINKEIYSNKYDVVIPLSDLSTQHIAMHLDEYSKHAKFPIPDYSVFMKAYDKQKTMNICRDFGIPCTFTKKEDESFEEFITDIGYPIVVKPKSACGSIGFNVIRDYKQWNEFLNVNDLNDYVVQEYVEQNGRQFNVHMFVDGDQNVIFDVATEKCRWFPIDGGASCFCRTIDMPELVIQCTKLLKAIKWKGYCEIELIEDKKNNTFKVIEINGRTSASIKICHLCGINVAKNMIELACDKNVTSQRKGHIDVRMRCLHTDTLWLLGSKMRFKTKPSWFNCRHTHDQIFSILDPIPFFTFTIQSIMKYKKEIKKRKR